MNRNTTLVLGTLLACLCVYACTPGLNPNDDDDDVFVAEVRVEPDSLDFGFIEAGSSGLERFEVVNETAGTIRLRSVTISPASDTFGLVSPPEEDFALPGGQERTINVSFTPVGEGESSATVVVETDHTEYPTLEVTLMGCSDPEGCGGGDDDDTGDDDTGDDDTGDDDTTDECGTIEVDPTTVSFSTTVVGQFATAPVTISNVGSGELEVTNIASSNTNFGYQGITPPTTIQAGGSLQFSARFEPLGSGPITGTLTISSCDGEVEISLEGEGEDVCDPCLPDINVSPIEIDFGTITGGTAMASFSIGNSGVDPLHLTSVTGTTSVAGGTVSILSGDTAATIQPGGTEYYTVEWAGGELFPGQGCLDALSTTADFITIHSNDPDEATVLIALDGCCDAATGGTFCTYGDLISLLMCMDTAPCSDPLTAILYCTLGLPC